MQNSPASWDVDFADASKDILITAFIDANKNSICDEKELSCGSWFTAVRGRPTNQTILLGKSAINVAVKGNPSIFSHPKLVHNGRQTASGSLIIAPLTIGSFVTYSDLTGKYGARGNMAAFDDADNNDRYDFGEPLISSGESQEWDWAPSKKVTVSLMATAPKQIPPSGKVYISIGGDNYLPSDTQHYRFEIDSSTKRLIFFIPLGKGTDGGFIQCFQCETNPPRSAWHTGEHLWNLFNLVYAGDSAKRSRVMSNWSNQTGEWKQNIRDAVRYLEGAKGFTVYGKELLN